jgi:ribosomal protein S18 acetylase RimI-like enzyme
VGKMVFEVVALENRHIREIVAVHIRAFPDFFLTFLGSGFLEEFYKSFLYDDQGIGFVAMDTETNEILGAIVGPLSPKGYFKRLLKRRWCAFCLASLVAVIKKPSVVKKLFRAVFYRGQSPQGKDRALLSSISVSPDAQGKGVGKALALRWLEEVKGRGSKGAFLTTDAENNDAINSFYQKLGWKRESVYTTSEGREMNRYTYDFEG